MENLLNRFLTYVKINTQSNENSENTPSTKRQFDLANLLANELKDLGLSDVEVDEHCYVYATLQANTSKKLPVIGFIAHLDTSPDFTAENVNPKIISNYDGKDIVLNERLNIVMKVEDFPFLKNYKGKTLITTDGTTLLGADDKAGISEIITAMEYFVKNPQVKHGTVKIAFTPDEEIGRGTKYFDLKKFSADFAYTVDGGELGELEFENFNAAEAKIFFKGLNVHPGTAKNKMINSQWILHEFMSLLPQNQKPEFTEGYEGFFHILKIEGDVENSFFKMIIRDHDFNKFKEKKDLIFKIVDFLNYKHGKNLVEARIKDQYYNMREKIEPVFFIIDIAKSAMLKAGINPKIKPIRGGTDGAMLSYKGLPTPNLFTGGHNFHGKFEFIPFESMQKAVEVIINIVKMVADM